MLQQIDGWLIDHLESVCHRIQWWTGKTNIFWRDLASVFQILLLFSVPVFCRNPFYILTALLVALIAIGVALSPQLQKHTSLESDQMAFARLRQGFLNAEKVDYKPRITISIISLLWMIRDMRLVFLQTGLEKYFDWILVSYFALNILRVYLTACDPLNPQAIWERKIASKKAIKVKIEQTV